MYQKLFDYLKQPPALYAPSSAAFWDDAHISRGMLAAHLNTEEDGATRAHAVVVRSADWIASLVSEPGAKLLDLGCGPGIYTRLFAERGMEVCGIDFSRRSIAYAQEREKEEPRGIRYRHQDYLTLDYEHVFDIVTLIYCDFGVLDKESRTLLLSKIHKALKKGGIFVMDVFSRRHLDRFVQGQSVTCEESGYWHPAPYVCVQTNRSYSSDNTLLEQYIVLTEEGTQCYNNWNHGFDCPELGGLLAHAGFSMVDFYGDITGAAFSHNADNICVVAQK